MFVSDPRVGRLDSESHLGVGRFHERAVPRLHRWNQSGEDIRKLDYGQHVVGGTPGRVFDMIKRRMLRTWSIKMLVLDEPDEMLNKGYKEQIYEVYR